MQRNWESLISEYLSDRNEDDFIWVIVVLDGAFEVITN